MAPPLSKVWQTLHKAASASPCFESADASNLSISAPPPAADAGLPPSAGFCSAPAVGAPPAGARSSGGGVSFFLRRERGQAARPFSSGGPGGDPTLGPGRQAPRVGATGLVIMALILP